jgi:hypothetical protein
MDVGCMNIIVLYSDHRHVSATHVAIFRALSTRTHKYIHTHTHSVSTVARQSDHNLPHVRFMHIAAHNLLQTTTSNF